MNKLLLSAFLCVAASLHGAVSVQYPGTVVAAGFVGSGIGITNLPGMVSPRTIILVDPVNGSDSIAASLAKGDSRAIWQNVTNAITNAVFGDVVTMLPGSNWLTTTLTLPKGVKLKGSGIQNTVFFCNVPSTGTEAAIKLSSFCELEDCSIFDTNTDAGFRFPVACVSINGADATTNAIARHLYISGVTDCFYMAGATNLVQVELDSCVAESWWDCLNGGSTAAGTTFTLRNCIFRSIYHNTFNNSGTGAPRVIVCGGGTMNFWGGLIQTVDAPGTQSRAIRATGSGTVINVSAPVLVGYTNAASWAARPDSGATINFYQTTFPTSLIDTAGGGTVNFVNSLIANLDGSGTNTDIYNTNGVSIIHTGEGNQKNRLNDANGNASVRWTSRQLVDTNGSTISVDWVQRKLEDSSGNISLDWSANGGPIQVGQTVEFVTNTYPVAPTIGGNAALWNSNSTLYILTSTPSGGSWAATNKLFGP